MDKAVLRAKAFLSRAADSDDPAQKLLCLYDGFVSLFGPSEACRRAAAEAFVDFRMLQRMVDGCMADGDSDNGRSGGYLAPTPEMTSALEKALARLVSVGELRG